MKGSGVGPLPFFARCTEAQGWLVYMQGELKMSWDAERYESWFDTEPGRFALEREARLLQTMVAGWPRRGTRLLEVGCGTGLFLEMLWQMGFDVTGLDKNRNMTDAARKRFGSRATIHQGNGEHLPFEDNEFDYVMLWSMLEFCSDPEAALAEASRVAERGLLIGFLNRNSLYYWRNVRGSDGTMSRAKLMSWYRMRQMVWNQTKFSPIISRSVLPGPVQTWKNTLFWRLVNNRCYPPWIGAFSAMRIDFVNIKPLTPLFAWRSEPELG